MWHKLKPEHRHAVHLAESYLCGTIPCEKLHKYMSSLFGTASPFGYPEKLGQRPAQEAVEFMCAEDHNGGFSTGRIVHLICLSKAMEQADFFRFGPLAEAAFKEEAKAIERLTK